MFHMVGQKRRSSPLITAILRERLNWSWWLPFHTQKVSTGKGTILSSALSVFYFFKTWAESWERQKQFFEVPEVRAFLHFDFLTLIFSVPISTAIYVDLSERVAFCRLLRSQEPCSDEFIIQKLAYNLMNKDKRKQDKYKIAPGKVLLFILHWKECKLFRLFCCRSVFMNH